MIIAEYIWIDAYGKPRSKTRVIKKDIDKEIKLDSFPMWNYDGCSNRINSNSDINININSGSDVLLKPQVFYRDPFRKPDNSRLTYLVLCDTYIDKNTPHPSNTRFNATKIFNKEVKPYAKKNKALIMYYGCNDIGHAAFGYDRRDSWCARSREWFYFSHDKPLYWFIGSIYDGE